MRLAERSLAVLLNEDGRHVLGHAGVEVGETGFLLVQVDESDDLGLWIRILREDGDHVLLVRWEYVLTADFVVGRSKIIGLR